MPDYNLTGLSTRSFEQMIQSLAVKVIGPGVVIFGDGPDGGREATYTGRLSDYPSSADCWDGYLVVQAKFCQRPKGKPKEDAQWAMDQLEKELKDFVKNKSTRKKPQYYVFATNVILSSVQRKGGKDRLSDLIDKYKKKIGLKDFRVWDYDQICRYIDTNENIRHAYAAWITAGDVLAKLSSAIEKASPNFGKIMLNFLQKEILDEHCSKLEQAGHSPENRVPLEKVFVDLPAFRERLSKPPDEQDPAKGLMPGFLMRVLETGSLCLRPEMFDVLPEKEREKTSAIMPEKGRYVLVGGPGQGKSTLTQFLCQIQRANLLKDRGNLDNDVKKIVRSIVESCNSQHLPLSVSKRFPLRIELARFAKILANQAETKVTSVLSYAVFLIKDRTGYEISNDDLRQWLEAYPWLVVLDGLDEVPASSNRAQVLIAVRDLLVDISTCNADVLVLATTRPQGYNEEFSPLRYSHQWLAPLSIHRALYYGQTLIELTYAHNVHRKKEIITRLNNAAGIQATARLMESPLQVTIMALLLAEVAQPPHERYKLFQQYYEVIYRREMERGVEGLSQLLQDQKPDIDAIHHRTGLLLQTESERTHHTDATISIEAFRTVVNDRLKMEGFSDSKLAALTDLITTCATDRLVFLVPSQSERVGFEIRSLQEFMAAEALMDGADNIVVDRLKTIAPVPFWQNVLLFAAGKCYAERQWLRDSVAQICAELNDNPSDNLAHLTMAGSRVALSLLEDGPARRQPAYSHTLMRQALTLLHLPPDSNHDRLADIYDPDFDMIYKEELESRLGHANLTERLASWKLLLKMLAEREITWLKDMAESYWPLSIADKIEIINSNNFYDNQWLRAKYSEVFFDIPLPMETYRRHIFEGGEVEKLFPENPLASHAISLLSGIQLKKPMITCRIKSFKPIEFYITPLHEAHRSLAPFISLKNNVHQYWKPLVEGALFVQKPSKECLANALRSIYPIVITDMSIIYRYRLPWPLFACLASAETSEDVIKLAERAEHGAFGDIDDWMAAEKRWETKGITVDDIRHMTDDVWPITPDIKKIGFPFAGPSLSPINQSVKDWSSLRNFWLCLPEGRMKSIFAEIIISTLYSRYALRSLSNFFDDQFLVPSEFIEELLAKCTKPLYFGGDELKLLYQHVNNSDKAGKIFNRLGNVGINIYSQHGELSDFSISLCNWVDSSPKLIHILNILSKIVQNESIDRIPKLVWQIDDDADDRIKRSVIMLKLVQSGLTESMFMSIAKEILDLYKSDQELLFSLIRIFEVHQINNKAGIAFLEKLLAELPVTSYEVRNKIVSLMLDIIGRREASLNKCDVWQKLCLPDGLKKLI